MPLQNGRLTPKERVFATALGNTGDAAYAAHRAGYKSAASSASQHSRNPGILAEARKITLSRLANEILPLAVGRHIALLQDPKTTGPTLTKAIEIAYKHGLAEREADDDKPLSELTAAELAQRAERGRVLVEALERERAERAKPVLDGEAEPIDEPSVFD